MKGQSDHVKCWPNVCGTFCTSNKKRYIMLSSNAGYITDQTWYIQLYQYVYAYNTYI